MARRVVPAVIILLALFGLTNVVQAQEASLTGTITDSTGAVLPGVTITATNEASGNTFTGVTDSRGSYVLPVRVGVYKLSAELTGFGTVEKAGIELLVGQESVVSLQMALQGVQETLTVTGDAPLVNTTQSKLGGNIDPRQTAELPINGRDWRSLAMMAPGVRQNAVSEGEPVERGKGAYQMNLDGQQVTSTLAHGAANAAVSTRFSRDAIAEFEIITSRFDATQGRSSGVQINAITKSGTNRSGGSFGGYFRDDKFNSKDFLANRVLTYQDQQFSGTYGGPIVRDKIHYFANWEFEREPQEVTSNSIYPAFNLAFTGTRGEHKAGVRTDFQLQSQTHFNVRWNLWRNHLPYNPSHIPSATVHGSRNVQSHQAGDQYFGTLTRMFGGHGVNELKGGYHHVKLTLESYVKNPKSLDPSMPGFGAPYYNFGSLYTIGVQTNTSQFNNENKTQIIDLYSMTFDAHGRHSMKVGGDYTYWHNNLTFCNACNGNLILRTVPTDAAAFQAMFPVWNDFSTWNLAPLSPLATQWIQGFGDMTIISPRNVFATYAQDDWAFTPKLTFNLGLRWDYYGNCCANDVKVEPFLNGHRPNQTDMIQPRVGFVYSITDRTVVRGGTGKYYAEVSNQVDHWARAYAQQATVSILNDGRADFASNPWNGAPPTYEQALSFLCTTNRKPGCLQTALRTQFVGPNYQVPYSYQSSLGFEQQVGADMSVQADYAYNANRHEDYVANVNLSYNPATGFNYPITDLARLPFPDFSTVNMTFTEGKSNLHSVQTAFTKRMSHRWQSSLTYTMSWFRDGHPAPLTVDLQRAANFPLKSDLEPEYGLASTDQRHRVTASGIFDAGYGFQLSGSYLYGSGQRFATSYGANFRNDGGTGGRQRPDGSITTRNNFVGLPIHRMDLRLMKRFRFANRMTADGIVEVFNALNHENYGSYTLTEASAAFGKPTQNNNVAYQSRAAQLAFRLAF